MEFDRKILSLLQNNLSQKIDNTSSLLLNCLRLLAKWRIELIRNTVIKYNGLDVISGPFEGMKFIENSAEGCHVPKLLGCYEQPLEPFLNPFALYFPRNLLKTSKKKFLAPLLG